MNISGKTFFMIFLFNLCVLCGYIYFYFNGNSTSASFSRTLSIALTQVFVSG